LNTPACLLLFYLSSAGLFLLPYGSYFVLMMSLYLTIFKNKTPSAQVCAVFNKFFHPLYIVYFLTITASGSLLAYTWKTQKLYFPSYRGSRQGLVQAQTLARCSRKKRDRTMLFNIILSLSYILDSNGHMPAYAMQFIFRSSISGTDL